ncbi:MAG: methyltransferase domain-containing protein [Candidatus Hodarchaeota archaeon]
MIPRRIAAILACPRCKSKPVIGKTVFCPQCECNYEIKADVPLMHIETDRREIGKRILRAKSAVNFTNFTEALSKGKDRFLLSSQYGNSGGTTTLSHFMYRIGKMLYPPAPVINRVITRKRRPLMDRFKTGFILNVGSGDDCTYEGVINFDLDLLPGVNVVGNGENLPFLDETFDFIINQAVLEHVRNPERVINEIFRVLKKSGYVYVEAPFLQEYHAFPLDFQRYTLTGLENLLSRFEKIESGVCAGPSAAFGRIFREYIASFSDNIYIHQILKVLAGWIIFPIRYLDLWLNRKRYAHVLAMGFYFIGQNAVG